jgi:CrcB protein
MAAYLLIALGSAIGGAARYWATQFVGARMGELFPWGTLAVNASGSLLIGILGALSQPNTLWHLSPDARLFLMVGLLGGFTTFSAFSLQTLNLMRDGEGMYAVAYAVGSVIVCLLAVWAGFTAAASLGEMRGS